MVFNKNDSDEFLNIPDDVDIEEFFQNYSFIPFNKNGYVRGDAKAQGIFLGHEYGEGMYLQNPADVLAFALINAHRNELDVAPDKYTLSVKAIKSHLKKMVDFDENLTQKDFMSAVDKTFSKKCKNVNEFFYRLEDNLLVEEMSEPIKYVLKNKIISQVKNVIKIDQYNNEKSLRQQIYAISASPNGYTKASLISKAYNVITENFAEDRWVRSLLNWLRAASEDEEYFDEMLGENDPYLQVLVDRKAYSLQSAAQRNALQNLTDFIKHSAKETYDDFTNREVTMKEFNNIM